jgi:hypothetical protein
LGTNPSFHSVFVRQRSSRVARRHASRVASGTESRSGRQRRIVGGSFSRRRAAP